MFNYIIFGASSMAEYILIDAERVRNVKCIAVVENNKQIRIFHGIPVINNEVLFSEKYSKIPVIMAIQNNRSCQEAIISIMNDKRNIFVLHPSAIYAKLRVFNDEGKFTCFVKHYKDIKPTFFDHIQIGITFHCNLNCIGCGSFSNISQEKYMSYCDFEKVILTLNNKFNSVFRLDFYGGEPLLNPELVNMIETASKLLPLSRLLIYTNGLRITDMSEELINMISTTRCCIKISQYPPTMSQIDKIVKFLEDNKIEYDFEHPFKGFTKMYTEKEGDSGVNFEICRLTNDCYTIWYDKIYPCGQLPQIIMRNDILNFRIDSEDIIDGTITISDDEMDGWNILKKLSKPKRLCKYCSPKAIQPDFEGRVSMPWSCAGNPVREDWVLI